MKKNHVWVIEGYDPQTQRWTPVYGEFYYSRRKALTHIPVAVKPWKYRPRKYEAN